MFSKKGKLNSNMFRENSEFFKSLLWKDILEYTQKINGIELASEKIYISLHGLLSKGTCIVCGNVCRFVNFTTGYSKNCSTQCGSITAAKNTKQVYFKTDEFKKKSKQTCLKKYGVEFASQSQIVRSKVSKTKQTLNYEQINKKRQETCLEKYNETSFSKTAEFNKKAKQTKLERYGNENYHNSDKANETKLLKYGDAKYNNLEKAKQTCLNRYGYISKQQKHIPKITLEKLNNVEWLINENKSKTLTKIALELNVTASLVYKQYSKYNINVVLHSVTGNKSSEFEKQIVKYIQETLDTEVKTNVRSIIKPYELDIYLPEYNLAIECNGIYWHSPNRYDSKLQWFLYHQNKIELCNLYNIQLLHIWENYGDYKKLVDNAVLGNIKNDLEHHYNTIKWA